VFVPAEKVIEVVAMMMTPNARMQVCSSIAICDVFTDRGFRLPSLDLSALCEFRTD
jgi:hypothetical protein